MSAESGAEPAPIVAGVARALSPLVRRVARDVDGAAGANTYLVGVDEVAVIDPGPDDRDHLAVVAGCGGDRIRWILTTGAQESSGAATLKSATGGEIVRAGGVGPLPADVELVPGDTLEGTEFRLRVVAAPLTGPAERVCFLLEEERMLFTGDCLGPEGSDVSTGPDEVTAWLEGLRKLRLRVLAPSRGHLRAPLGRPDPH